MSFWRNGFSKGEAAPSTNPGERIYAIGDIHGRDDLLIALLARIEAHSAALPEPESQHIVLLGDLVDRGPRSAAVLKLVREVQRADSNMIVLQGNHEDLMLRALAGEPGMLRAWMRVGGKETLRSFGLEPPPREADPAEAIAKIIAEIPPQWLAWLRNLPLTARSGSYHFCHAGIRPGVPLKRQTRSDLLWIRDDFLVDERDHGAVIVHGHSISEEVEIRPNRIGIDTGAYQTGALTALYLEGTEREIISTGSPPALAEASSAGVGL